MDNCIYIIPEPKDKPLKVVFDYRCLFDKSIRCGFSKFRINGTNVEEYCDYTSCPMWREKTE